MYYPKSSFKSEHLKQKLFNFDTSPFKERSNKRSFSALSHNNSTGKKRSSTMKANLLSIYQIGYDLETDNKLFYGKNIHN